MKKRDVKDFEDLELQVVVKPTKNASGGRVQLSELRKPSNKRPNLYRLASA